MSGYQNLQDEVDEYVPTEVIQEQQQPQIVQQQMTTQQKPQEQQQPAAQQIPQSTQQQVFYAVPTLGPNGQTQLTYIPQAYYAQMMQQQQQMYLQQQYQAQQQQAVQQQLPPLPNVNHQIPQQQPQYIPSSLPVQPNVTPISNPTIQVTEESYVKVQGVEPLLVLLCNLFFPGLGHLVIGQQAKGALYLAISIVSASILGVLCAFFVGIPLIPLYLVYNILILIDGYVIADRIKKGYPVLKGECYFRVTSWGVSLVETKSPVFVHGSADEPAVWQLQCRQVDQQRNL